MLHKNAQFSLPLLEDELLIATENLESCLFITSHILRAHVARITGLLSLLKHTEGDIETKKILAKVEKEIALLNTSIRETKGMFSHTLFNVGE